MDLKKYLEFSATLKQKGHSFNSISSLSSTDLIDVSELIPRSPSVPSINLGDTLVTASPKSTTSDFPIVEESSLNPNFQDFGIQGRFYDKKLPNMYISIDSSIPKRTDLYVCGILGGFDISTYKNCKSCTSYESPNECENCADLPKNGGAFAKFRIHLFDDSNIIITVFTKEVPSFLNIPLAEVMKYVNESSEEVITRVIHLYLGHPIAFKVKIKELKEREFIAKKVLPLTFSSLIKSINP